MLGFGSRLGDKKAQQQQDDDNITWIRPVRGEETKLRLLQPTAEWFEYKEHFSNGPLKAFTCSQAKDCVGCNDPDEDVRDRSTKIAVNALDDEGRLRVYKLHASTAPLFVSKEQRRGTVTDRDYIIVRTGSGQQTRYVPEDGEKYDIDFSGPLYDLEEVVKSHYFRAAEHYLREQQEAEEEPMEVELAAEVASEPNMGAPMRGKPSHEENEDDDDEIEMLSTRQLREFLVERDVDFDEKGTPRRELIRLAKKARADAEPIPF